LESQSSQENSKAGRRRRDIDLRAEKILISLRRTIRRGSRVKRPLKGNRRPRWNKGNGEKGEGLVLLFWIDEPDKGNGPDEHHSGHD